jgi:mannitol-1-/sugar-/sorbitol-6-/2-deoxyglucose-6-phosphatase
MIKAVIFDMDGLLIDSEPFWQDAEIEIFGTLGIKLERNDCKQFQGVKVEEVIKHWFEKYNWKNKSVDDVINAIINRVKELVIEKGCPMDGVEYIIDFCRKKNLKIALASSSDLDLIQLVIKKLNLDNQFEVVHSAQFEKAGKPAPDVFLTTAEKLNILPENCMVFEDSYFGIMAAKSAGMKSVAIPEHAFFHLEKFDIADLKLRNLNEFNELMLNKLSKMN